MDTSRAVGESFNDQEGGHFSFVFRLTCELAWTVNNIINTNNESCEEQAD